jgi:hypothetical protein
LGIGKPIFNVGDACPCAIVSILIAAVGNDPRLIAAATREGITVMRR